MCVCVCVCLLGTGPSWSRGDGLGAVNAADFLDLPAEQSAMVESFLEKSAYERNSLKLAWHRWQLQITLWKVSSKKVLVAR